MEIIQSKRKFKIAEATQLQGEGVDSFAPHKRVEALISRRGIFH